MKMEWVINQWEEMVGNGGWGWWLELEEGRSLMQGGCAMAAFLPGLLCLKIYLHGSASTTCALPASHEGATVCLPLCMCAHAWLPSLHTLALLCVMTVVFPLVCNPIPAFNHSVCAKTC